MDLLVPLVVQLTLHSFSRHTRSPEVYSMLADVCMLRLPQNRGFLVRYHSPSVLQRNRFHLKQRSHLSLDLLQTLLTIILHNLLLFRLIRQWSPPMFKPLCCAEQKGHVPDASKQPHAGTPLLSCCLQRAGRALRSLQHYCITRSTEDPPAQNLQSLRSPPILQLVQHS